MSEPPFLPAPPPTKALLAQLGAPPKRCLVAGPLATARALAKAGHQVTWWCLQAAEATQGPPPTVSVPIHVGSLEGPPPELGDVEALVLVGALTGLADPAPVLDRLVKALEPGTLVLMLEPAASRPGGRWLGRLLGAWRGHAWLSDASTLAALCLSSGLREIQQRWPQGLRSLVLTVGRVGRAHALEP